MRDTKTCSPILVLRQNAFLFFTTRVPEQKSSNDQLPLWDSIFLNRRNGDSAQLFLGGKAIDNIGNQKISFPEQKFYQNGKCNFLNFTFAAMFWANYGYKYNYCIFICLCQEQKDSYKNLFVTKYMLKKKTKLPDENNKSLGPYKMQNHLFSIFFLITDSRFRY